jgi:uncharacterized protein (TIGR00725 family)
MRRFIVGVMGAGEGATESDKQMAFRLGEAIARADWVLLSGGRAVGVMQEVNRGAKQIAGSLTIGILPNAKCRASEFVDVQIVTDMGNARNNINVLTSDVVVACGTGGVGTVSEIALAMKAGKPVILLGCEEPAKTFFRSLNAKQLFFAETPERVIEIIRNELCR